MKSLKDIILESLDDNNEEIKQIKDFIKKNYSRSLNIRVSKEKNSDDKYIVTCTNNYVELSQDATAITNGIFVWGEIPGSFDCAMNDNIDTLYGAPVKVGGYFSCSECESLLSLEYAPKEVGTFTCSKCNSLKSLEGGPEIVHDSYSCSKCKSLISLKGSPKAVKYFRCDGCKSLKSLQGCPKDIDKIKCNDCGKQFTEKEIYSITNISNLIGEIIV